MKSDVFSKFRTLRSKAYNSYWERRILAEVGYLIELLILYVCSLFVFKKIRIR